MQNEAAHFLSDSDPILSKIMASIPAPTYKSTQNVFHDLMSCILEQQIHYRSTKKTFQKMLDASALQTLTLDTFNELEAKALATANLSIGRYETVQGVLEFWSENNRATNHINWSELSNEEVAEKLSAIKGIGRWTIDMILLYTLQRPNVFPADDFHLKEIMVKLYGLNPNSKLKAQMLDVADAWGEHKSLAVRYLLAWKEYNKKQM